MTLLGDLLADLDAEAAQLRAAVAGLDDAAWATPTPAPGWSIATQVAHLAWTDERALLAAGAHTPEGARAWDAEVARALRDPAAYVDEGAHELARLEPAVLLARWDSARAALVEALRAHPSDVRLPWYGPPMSATSMATARLMETWAHALDVHDALGARPAPTDRIRHVAHLGVSTRDHAYATRGETPPAEPFRVQLDAPSGAVWTWGPTDAAQTVSGPAYDFCLLVTQRTHPDDTTLVVTGPDAQHWLRIAQAFAGPPGPGRARSAPTDASPHV
ncbi:TIGR03084 family protein [Nocardioides sp. dk4132]|uniref:TIGR03084 family metal-binding protein n=1 Tax=unclassified Nocardioides TaxID=2615069 RepID=UPI0012949696|nr:MULTISPECIES: TIGR03084 family metal-binding protein [unclassified Nocardioides]MQW76942.1 TIGR03084 family protein [Nocardioides sp. dk4132]QGA09363.1 TIGR03084 family protein [Nocardioides sp. dk884]